MSLEPTGFSRRVSRNRCAFIRWKGMFIDSFCAPENHSSNDSAIWCQYTSKCVGPDGKLVDEFECSPARECYEKL